MQNGRRQYWHGTDKWVVRKVNSEGKKPSHLRLVLILLEDGTLKWLCSLYCTIVVWAIVCCGKESIIYVWKCSWVKHSDLSTFFLHLFVFTVGDWCDQYGNVRDMEMERINWTPSHWVKYYLLYNVVSLWKIIKAEKLKHSCCSILSPFLQQSMK